MRFAFNSYSMESATLPQLVAAAELYGYDGIELRLESGHGHGVEIDIDEADLDRARRVIDDSGTQIVCLCTSSKLSDPRTAQADVERARRSIGLAAALGAPTIRVFGGAFADDISRNDARLQLVTSLRSLAGDAAAHGVVVCVETHDAWSDPLMLADVMTEVDDPNIGVLWDVWHTGRGAGVSLEHAHDAIRPWLAHVQVHDGALRLDRLEFRAIGEGDVDHLKVLALLRRSGYAGAIGGEWINWQPAEVHLPRELATLRSLEALLSGTEH